ncbi:MAG: D-2-hydroxyacid dehydrogenase [Lactobacillaceae bacterium]|jgi:D-lactate dehydrogenase|nr:D-2-hydroxyacid dehydrogenase [Lactobacillaceae bacterium]
MKIFAYFVRDDEIEYFDNWAKQHPEVEVEYTSEILTLDNVARAKGADVINTMLMPVTAEIIAELSSYGINIITTKNVGTDNIDFDAARKYGFKISNVPSYSPNAIAEHAVMQILRSLRQAKVVDARILTHDLRWAPTIGRELRMQTVGVIGTGNIGRVVIQILQGFGAKVVAYDLYRNADIETQGLYVDSLEELYRQADVISLHVPGVPANDRMINADTIALMKDRAVLVNVSRGNLVDTNAVLAALDSGKLAAFALDAYEAETGVFNADWRDRPFPDARLAAMLERQDILVTPHSAFYTDKAVEEMVTKSLDNGLLYMQGETPASNIPV